MQTFTGLSGLQVTHPFPASTSYTISVTATDPSSNGSLPASTSISLTTLAMETDLSNPNQTALYVGGTTGNDNIAITPAVMTVNGSTVSGVKVGMNGVNYGNFFPTGHVLVYSQSGNDIIKTAAQTINGALTYVSVPVMFFAGNGNDILNVTGSSANNVLVGGGGMDRLLGGQGRDILIGGSGTSTLNAGSGGDILIGGTTDYDINAVALASVLAEWTSADDYATRIAHITGSLNGGLNTVFLNSNTVHADGQVNHLFGGAGLDWYFAGIMDMIFNKASGEVVTQT
jgi:Ca2+-binding RTX toxin-like protein